MYFDQGEKVDEEIINYINLMKDVNEEFLSFIDNSGQDSEKNYENLVQIIEKNDIQKDKETFNHFIGIIVNIANNHHRQAEFFNKIERILINYGKTIKKHYSNIEIYDQFQSNKRLLYILIKNDILLLDTQVSEIIESTIDFNGKPYSDFFLNELCQNDIEIDNDDIINIYNSVEYDEKRQIGENDSYICSLIRQDLVEEFVAYVNRTNTSLSSKIKPSIFETNILLIEKEPTLIEYAAFFGSIEIFQYLYLNNVYIDYTIWIYAIHSNNSNFIRNCIENTHIKLPDTKYLDIFLECIKCHHNEIGNYVENNLINEITKQKQSFNAFVFSNSLKYNNFIYIPDILQLNNALYYFCKYNYPNIVDILIKSQEKIINQLII